MLATVLKGELAEQQSIFIMRAFRELRHIVRQNQQFVSSNEMAYLSARMSELSLQTSVLGERQSITERQVSTIQESIDKQMKTLYPKKTSKILLYIKDKNLKQM